MRNKKIYGLIGKDIDYSFSRKYFLEKFNHYNYLNFDLERVELIEEVFTNNKLNGLNVTIPYKEKIIPFLDELSPVAKEIGSVNTICFVGSKKIGYNTDIYGFDKTLSALNIDEIDYALVLGTGGASKAISYVLSKRKIKFNHVSRTLKKDYLKFYSSWMTQTDQSEQKLKEYEQEHRDLDQILIQLQDKHTVYFLQIQRLKKRKLVLKDKIIDLRNKLEPDIIA